jgi:hypothetical protein
MVRVVHGTAIEIETGQTFETIVMCWSLKDQDGRPSTETAWQITNNSAGATTITVERAISCDGATFQNVDAPTSVAIDQGESWIGTDTIRFWAIRFRITAGAGDATVAFIQTHRAP